MSPQIDENPDEMFSEYLALNQELDQQEELPGQERYVQQIFDRNFTVYRFAQLGTKIVELSDPRIQMPTGSIVHLFDDCLRPYDAHQDTPDMSLYPLINRESFKKFIYHTTQLNRNTIKFEDKYILKFAGLPTNLMKFRAEHGSEFRYCYTLDQLPAKMTSMIVVNHNPVFRMRMFGRMQYFRIYQQIWAHILNTCIDIAKKLPEKQQYLMVPWESEVYDRATFIRTRQKLTVSTMKYPNSYQYLTMMHLINFMIPGTTTSIFDMIPKEYLKNLNFMLFTANGHYCIFNLDKVKGMTARPMAFLKMCNQLNTLALIARVSADATKEEKQMVMNSIEPVEEQIEEEGDSTDEVLEPLTKQLDAKESRPAIVIKNLKELIPDEPEQTDEVRPDGKVTVVEENAITQITPEEDRAKTRVEQQQAAQATSAEERKEAVINHLARKIVGSRAPDAKQGILKELRTRSNLLENSSQTEIRDTDVEAEASTMEFNQEEDTKASNYIEESEILTPKQKERYERIAKQYKELTIHGTSFEKILTEQHDIVIDKQPIGDNVVGDMPADNSVRNCSLRAYEKSYLKKSYTKQLAGILTAFRRVGIYLTDIKEEHVQTPLNNDVIYTCKYLDAKGNQSTVKLKLPVVDNEGRIFVDGIYKVLKKQRVNLPLVKISDTEVSLSSNYNKYRVIKNEAKAHDFFTYIDSFTNSAKSNAVITFGNNDLNLKISYEYCMLARNYAYVRWNLNGVEFDLCFNYYERVKHSGLTTEKLDKLESKYGVYFGKVGKDGVFVDVHNRVYGITGTGAEDPKFELDTITKIFKCCLKEGESVDKVLTEWTTMKILDANLPVIFLLAYRFGLRKALDLIGLKYTITEKRTKTIVGSAGTEAFGGDVDNVVVGGSVVQPDGWIKISDGHTIAGTEDLDEPIKYVPQPGDIPIKFADRILWFNRYPLKHSLIVAGLDAFDLTGYEMATFESKEIYYQLLLDIGKSMNYIKGIDSFFDLFIDPITYNVLKAMHEPTTPELLLLRATELLTTVDHRSASSNLNHRIRGYEQFNAIIYNELSRQVASYQAGRGKGNVFAVNPEAVYLRIVTNASLVPVTSTNPLQDIKEASELTHAGIGGRTEESFVVNDRRYTKDDIGVMAVDTVDNGKVGLSAMLTMNPGILNTEGLTKPKPREELEPADVLSMYSLLFPFATNDD